MPLVYTTGNGTPIYVKPGKKSPNDFRVEFMGPYRRSRTPKHIHLIVELYVKQAFDRKLTLELCDRFLFVFERVQSATGFPPSLQIFQPADAKRFEPLDGVGEFTAEFLLVVNELTFIQEKTNYPAGVQTRRLYEDFKARDRFTVIRSASWRGSKRK